MIFQLYVYVYELNTLFSNIAATHCPPGSPYIEAPQILDVAVCCYPPNMFHIDDYTATSSDISLLVELDIYNHSKRFSFIGIVLFGGLLPCFCKRVGTPQTARKVHVHQGDCFLLLLAGIKILSSFSLLCITLIHYSQIHAEILSWKTGRVPFGIMVGQL